MSLPSAEFARSNLPPPPSQDQIETQKKKETEDEERRARDKIRAGYHKGLSSIYAFDCFMPETVIQEMRDLGWEVERNDDLRMGRCTTFILPELSSSRITMNDQLPTAEYARSKMPTKEQIKAEKKKEMEAEEAKARKQIKLAYKEGSDRIEVDVVVSDRVQDEMRALGWSVDITDVFNPPTDRRYYTGSYVGRRTIFYLPKEEEENTNQKEKDASSVC